MAHMLLVQKFDSDDVLSFHKDRYLLLSATCPDLTYLLQYLFPKFFARDVIVFLRFLPHLQRELLCRILDVGNYFLPVNPDGCGVNLATVDKVALKTPLEPYFVEIHQQKLPSDIWVR